MRSDRSARRFPYALVLAAGLLCTVHEDARAQTIPGSPRAVRVYSGSATVPAVTITVSPATATIQPGANLQFQAAVTGTSNTSVVWRATGGTITSAGAYTAGQTAGTYAVTATLSGGTLSGSASVTIGSAQTYVDISPGQDIQSRITQYPNGTAFRLRSGIHRLPSPLTPKDGMSFTGESGTVVSGARQLSSFTRSGSYWVASGQTQQGQVHGGCESGYPRCSYPEDLYIDNVLLRHVATLAEVGPGRWFFDYGNDRIYFADDPTGKRVETTVTRHAFGGTAQSVTVSGLILEKFANPAQAGAVDGDRTAGWTVRDNEIRFNHGVGVRTGHRMRLLRNNIHRNGQMGIGGSGNDVLVEGNEIAYNNTAHFEAGWEAGGTKWVATRNLIVRGNNSHHNRGPGLWTDIDNIYTTYEDNVVDDNVGPGIFHEISYDAVIRRNMVRRNGYGFTIWMGGAGIEVAASSNVEVYGNTVIDNGNGIGAMQQNRGTGAYGPWVVQNLWVHDNVITMNRGSTGLVQDIGDNSYFTSRNNRFTNNTYHLGTNASPFAWMNQWLNESQWRSYGQDVTGTFNR